MIAEARFYPDIADELAAGALAELEAVGATVERHAVPGAFELPGAIRLAIEPRGKAGGARPRFDGYIALGCVLRGETSHYDIVCAEAARGLQELVVRHAIALGFGLLTCEDREQAMARASRSGRNSGATAARACLRMIELREAVMGSPETGARKR